MSHSSDTPHTHLPPPAAPAYLHRLVGQTLQRRGFEACEAGALGEMERLIEHHIQRLFTLAHDYAALTGRTAPNARDLLAAQEASGWGVRDLAREAKKQRIGVDLVVEEEQPEPTPTPNITSVPEDGGDVKPRLERTIPPYAYDSAPSLPPAWTYKPDRPPTPPLPAGNVTSGVLDFIKLTATERGDIPPELGLVDYRRGDGREARRKWGVRGVGAA
ncbi:uncharacterized protein LOC62_04G006436 [Vanrija pseudolonga]|uniref:Bromodomain associated domain-containing protein n=1 Tax=Vanrija pseudolonga TaxID=143232 RepID=A0AAF0YDR3_9TREE|nr:hypothetical protein LOC62_04G006436 [Vanrija pseudolonga]